MAGRIMTRMTTDVDALSTFLQTGLASALASLLTVVGDHRGAAGHRPRAGAGGADRAADRSSSRRSSSSDCPSRPTRTRASRSASSTRTCRRTCPGCGSRRPTPARSTPPREFAERSDTYRRTRLRAQRYVATYFPFVTLLAGVAQAAVLGVGAARRGGGRPVAGRAARRSCCTWTCSSPRCSSCPRCSTATSRPGSGCARIARPAAHADLGRAAGAAAAGAGRAERRGGPRGRVLPRTRAPTEPALDGHHAAGGRRARRWRWSAPRARASRRWSS